MKIPQGILALNWGAASGRIKGADIFRSCKVLTSKLSFSFVLAPASLPWNSLPALSCKAQPRRGLLPPWGPVPLRSRTHLPSQSRDQTALGGS